MGMNEMNALGLGSEWWWGCGQLECLVRFLPVPFRYSMQQQPYPLNAGLISKKKMQCRVHLCPKYFAPFNFLSGSHPTIRLIQIICENAKIIILHTLE
jgi:hypothetical protein